MYSSMRTRLPLTSMRTLPCWNSESLLSSAAAAWTSSLLICRPTSRLAIWLASPPLLSSREAPSDTRPSPSLVTLMLSWSLTSTSLPALSATASRPPNICTRVSPDSPTSTPNSVPRTEHTAVGVRTWKRRLRLLEIQAFSEPSLSSMPLAWGVASLSVNAEPGFSSIRESSSNVTVAREPLVVLSWSPGASTWPVDTWAQV